jgi:diaminopimelate epimerase
MDFEKWEGLGNDFVLVDCTGEPSGLGPDDAVKLCDRRRGIGGDGLLLIEREPALRMTVLNADGSRPEMCGNGIRCVAGWLAAHGDAARELSVLTDAGPRVCHIETGADGEYQVRVHMGAATVLGELRDASGRHYQHVDVGNPHAVSFDAHEDTDLDDVGPAFQRAVDGGINVELCTLRDAAIEVIVWERGVGRTQACGTGACAVAAAAVHRGMMGSGEAIEVRLPGGALQIVVEEQGDVWMTGPARRVFRGRL